jgi:hypothetical protein
MSARLLAAVLAAASLAPVLRAADEPEPPRTSAREALRARMAEDAKKAAPRPAAKPAAKSAAAAPAAAPVPSETGPAATAASSSAPAATKIDPAPGPATPPASAAAAAAAQPAAKNAPAAPATVLPRVEVKKARITVLDQQLAEQEREIARERKNLKVSETDLALNDMKIAKPLAIFGGDSAQFRQRVASERVELMEAEKDLIEAIAHARTKEQKAELQTQLDQLREMRRQLDKTLR